MEGEKVVYGLIGYGGMGGWHAELLSKMEEIVFAGIWDIKEEARERGLNHRFHVYESEEALLSDKKIDVILVATPNDQHLPIARRGVMAGKHVVLEKPAVLSSEELQELVMLRRIYGKIITVHQNRRWDDDYLTVKRICKEKKLGEIYRIESRVHGSRGIPGDWRRMKEHGGGMVLDWGVHLLDQILLLTEGNALRSVYATLTNVTNKIVDDGFCATLLFENGLQAVVEVGTSNFVSLPRWYVLGENGTAIVEDWDLSGRMVLATGVNEKDVVPVRTAAGLTKTMAPRREDTIHTVSLPMERGEVIEFHKNVARSVLGQEEPIVTLDQVGKVIRVMEAIFQSAEKNQVVFFS